MLLYSNGKFLLNHAISKPLLPRKIKVNIYGDAFISGITSSSICQCLLEKSSLALQGMYTIARSLEQAVKRSECYENSKNTMAATISHPEAVLVAPIQKNIQQSSACFFCGNPCHSRLLYLAHNAECKKCKKKKDIGLRYAELQLLLLHFTNLMLPHPCLARFGTKTKDITLTKCKINGYIINTIVDSGSVRTFVSKNIAKELNLFIIPKQKNNNFSRSYSTC